MPLQRTKALIEDELKKHKLKWGELTRKMGAVEKRILALQERKAALADRMYSGAIGRKQPLFTENDLAELLRPLDSGAVVGHGFRGAGPVRQ